MTVSNLLPQLTNNSNSSNIRTISTIITISNSNAKLSTVAYEKELPQRITTITTMIMNTCTTTTTTIVIETVPGIIISANPRRKRPTICSKQKHRNFPQVLLQDLEQNKNQYNPTITLKNAATQWKQMQLNGSLLFEMYNTKHTHIPTSKHIN